MLEIVLIYNIHPLLFPPVREARVMKKLAIAAFAALALAAAALLPRRSGPSAPAVAADKPAAGRQPRRTGHRRHRRGRRCAGAAQRDRHGAGLQHGHDQEPGRRPDRQASISTKARTSRPATPLIQIDPRPYQAALEQAQATKQKDEAQLASAQADLDALRPSWSARAIKSRQSYDQQKAHGRPAAGRDQGRRGADRHRPAQSRLCRHPRADRRPARRAAGR